MTRHKALKGFVSAVALSGLLACGSANAQLITLHAEGTVDLLLAIQFQHFQNGDPISLDIVIDGSSTETGSAGNERQFVNAVSSISVTVADFTASGTGTLSLFDDEALQDFNGPPPVLDLFSVRSTPGTGLVGGPVDGLTLDGLQFDLGFASLDPSWFTNPGMPLSGLPFGSQQQVLFIMGFSGPFDQRVVIFRNLVLRPIPLPAAVWLLGSGVMGMAGWRRKSAG